MHAYMYYDETFAYIFNVAHLLFVSIFFYLAGSHKLDFVRSSSPISAVVQFARYHSVHDLSFCAVSAETLSQMSSCPAKIRILYGCQTLLATYC